MSGTAHADQDDSKELQKQIDKFFKAVAKTDGGQAGSSEGMKRFFKSERVDFGLKLFKTGVDRAVAILPVVKAAGELGQVVVPYLSIVSQASGDLEEFFQAFASNQDAAKELPGKIQRCGTIVANDMATKVSPEDQESFRLVATDFMAHLLFTWQMCNKWRNMSWFKQLRVAKQYSRKFDDAKVMIDNLLLQVVAAFDALSEGHAQVRHQEICAKLSKITSLEKSVTAFSSILSEISIKLDTLSSVVEAQHSAEMTNLGSIQDKVDQLHGLLSSAAKAVFAADEALISTMEENQAHLVSQLDLIIQLQLTSISLQLRAFESEKPTGEPDVAQEVDQAPETVKADVAQEVDQAPETVKAEDEEDWLNPKIVPRVVVPLDDSYNWPDSLYAEASDMAAIAFLLFHFVDVVNKSGGISWEGMDQGHSFSPQDLDRLVSNIDDLEIDRGVKACIKALCRHDTSGLLNLMAFRGQDRCDFITYAVTKDVINKRITVCLAGDYGDKAHMTWNAFIKMAQINVHQPAMFSQEKIQLHQGFYECLFPPGATSDTSVYTEILRVVKRLVQDSPGFKVYLTGWSFGAALSSIVAFYLACDDSIPKPVTCMNFASPRVGNGGFAKAVNDLEEKWRLRFLRIVNEDDGIPSSPLSVLFLTSYYQAGCELRLRTDDPPEFAYPKLGDGGFVKDLWNMLRKALRVVMVASSTHSFEEYRQRLYKSNSHLQEKSLNQQYSTLT